MGKRLLSILLPLIFVLVCAFGLIACGNGTDGETVEVKGKTYEFVELTVAYSADFPEDQKTDEDALNELFSGTTLTFGTDGTFEWEAMQQTGTYTQERNTVTFTAQGKTYTGTVSGDDLTLTDKTEFPDSTEFVTMSIKYTVRKSGTGNKPGATTANTVTEEEWQNALSKSAFTNFTVTMKVGDVTGYLKADLDNNIFYVKGYSFGDNGGYTETYYTKEGAEYYYYDKSATDETFSRRLTNQSSFEGMLYDAEPLGVLNFSANYSDFQFDGEKYTTDNAGSYGLKLRFENKKLVCTELDAGQDGLLIMEYSYGETSVTPPTDFVNVGIAAIMVTADEWNAAFSAQVKSFTAKSVQGGYSDEMIQKFDYERNIYYVTLAGDSSDSGSVSTTYRIVTKENGNCYSYTSADEVTWERESISEDDYNDFVNTYGGSMTMILSGLKEKYDSFTFAEVGYRAENIDLPPMGTMNEVTVTFDNGKLKVLEYKIDNVGMQMTQRIEFGVAELEIPTNYTEKA